MKKLLASLFTVFLFVSVIKAATYPNSVTITDSTTWTLAGSPYYVTGNVNIGDGGTLVIEPGVKVEMRDKTSFFNIAHGKLIARGTENNPITIRPAYEHRDTGGWRGFVFETNEPTLLNPDSSYASGNILEYCNISYATPAIHVKKNGPIIQNCTFYKCGSGVNNGGEGGVSLAPVQLERWNSLQYDSSLIVIRRNTFTENICNNGCVYISSFGNEPFETIISNNIFYNNSTIANSSGIYIIDSYGTINNNYFEESVVETKGYAIVINGDSGGSFNISENTLKNVNSIANIISQNNAVISNNNFINVGESSLFSIENSANASFTQNSWGTVNTNDINALIQTVGTGSYNDQSLTPLVDLDTLAPIQTVEGAWMDYFAGSIIYWKQSLDTNVVGYKLYIRVEREGEMEVHDFAYSAFDNVIDVGTDTSYDVSSYNSQIAQFFITAYDANYNQVQAATMQNIFNGNESWLKQVITAMGMTYSNKNETCFGAQDGYFTTTVMDGFPPYTYNWSNGSTESSIIDLSMGGYTVTVTDSEGYTTTNSVQINSPSELIFASSHTDVSCYGKGDGAINVTATGGSPSDGGYSYYWSDNNNGMPNHSSLNVGTYTVTINDGTCAVTAIINITSPAVITTQLIADNPLQMCANGDVTFSLANSYSTYIWSNGSTNSTLTTDTAMTVHLETIDANGCHLLSDTLNTSVQLPYQEQICMVLIDSLTGKNTVVWEKTYGVRTARFNIFRMNAFQSYNQIGQVAFDEPSIFVDDDPSVNPIVQSYRYKISTVDSCGVESVFSTFHQTLHLATSESVSPFGINLSWVDQYQGFDFTTYNVYRGSTVDNMQIITQVSNTNTSFLDIDPIIGQSFYLLAAIKNDGECSIVSNKRAMTGPFHQSLSNMDQYLIVGKNEITNDVSVSVYPNPFSTTTTIRTGKNNPMQSVAVMDMTGKTVLVKENINASKVEINRNALATGMYLVKINANKSFFTKIIVE